MPSDPLILIEECGAIASFIEKALIQYGLKRTREAIKKRYLFEMEYLRMGTRDDSCSEVCQRGLDKKLAVMPRIVLGLPFRLAYSDYVVPGLESDKALLN